MVVAINPNESFEYVCEADRLLEESDPHRTVWLLRPLTRQQRAATEDIVRTDPKTGEVVPMVGRIKQAVLQVGIEGVRNFRDAEGNEIALERTGRRLHILGGLVDPPTSRFLDRIPPTVEHELCNAITEGNRLSVEEGKGLSSQQP